uniref:Uncharacterized protein n=1 Tax=Rhizophora mucronata TaxID=61149 RepID=A0A2P2JGW6_RHIMU
MENGKTLTAFVDFIINCTVMLRIVASFSLFFFF